MKEDIVKTQDTYYFFSCRSPPVAPAPIGSGSGRDRERQHVVRKREDWVTLSHYELQTDQMST